MRQVVSVGTCDEATSELQARICRLERRVQVLTAVMVLLLTVIRVARLNLTNTRVSNPGDRARLLRAIGRSEGVLPKAQRSGHCRSQLEPVRAVESAR